MALGRAAEELRHRESLERSDEENLKEECSSTESTHHEVRGHLCHAVPGRAVPCCAVPRCADLASLQHEELAGPRAREVQRLEEERAAVLGHVDRLKGRAKELEQQLQETSREVRGWGVPHEPVPGAVGRSRLRPGRPC